LISGAADIKLVLLKEKLTLPNWPRSKISVTSNVLNSLLTAIDITKKFKRKKNS
jgi:hypothetical protein